MVGNALTSTYLFYLHGTCAGVEPYLCQALHQGGQLSLPRRTLVVEDRTKLLFSDYMLVDEEETDSLQRLSQTLSLPTTSTDRPLLAVEKPAPAAATSAASATTAKAKPSPGTSTSSLGGGGAEVLKKAPAAGSSSSFLPLLMLGGGLLIVIIAILISLNSAPQ